MPLPETCSSTPSPSPPPSPSHIPFSQCDNSEWSPTVVLIPVVYMLVFALGTLGNGLVLCVYLSQPRRGAANGNSRGPSSRRSIINSLIVNLAAADLASVLTLPLWAVYTAMGYQWPFCKPLCQLTSYIVSLSMYASVFSLTGLSMERYRVIARRPTTRLMSCVGLRRTPIVVAVVWMAAGVLALPALLLRTDKQVSLGKGSDDRWEEEDEFISTCQMDFPILTPAEPDSKERKRLKLLWTAALRLMPMLLGFLLPLAALLLCYCSLGRLLAQHFREGPLPDPKRQRRLLRVIITLVLAFFLCWLPHHTNRSLFMLMELELLPYSCTFKQLLVIAYPYTICLGYVNSCLNPLLYACWDTTFCRRRRALLKNLWCKRWCTRETEDEEEE